MNATLFSDAECEILQAIASGGSFDLKEARDVLSRCKNIYDDNRDREAESGRLLANATDAFFKRPNGDKTAVMTT